MAPIIRPATPDDAETVHELITGLAVYEHEPDAVEVTPTELRRQLAQSPAPFECVLAELDGEAVGFALFFPTYSTWRGRPGLYIEDLFVSDRHRRRGVGAALVRYVARLARSRGCARVEWAVLDWNAPAIAFYRALGSEPLGDWTTHRLTGAALERLTR